MISLVSQDSALRKQLRDVLHRSVLTVVPVAFITCLVSFMPVCAAGSEPEPTEAIKGTVTELFSILKEFQGLGRSQTRRHEIERVIRRTAHYEGSLAISIILMTYERSRLLVDEETRRHAAPVDPAAA